MTDPEDPPQVWAHETLEEELDNVVRTGSSYFIRAMRQFGVLLPPEASTALKTELKFGRSNPGSLYPTHLVHEEHKDVNIAGIYCIFDNLSKIHFTSNIQWLEILNDIFHIFRFRPKDVSSSW